jgi:hypothetical protein
MCNLKINLHFEYKHSWNITLIKQCEEIKTSSVDVNCKFIKLIGMDIRSN